MIRKLRGWRLGLRMLGVAILLFAACGWLWFYDDLGPILIFGLVCIALGCARLATLIDRKA